MEYAKDEFFNIRYDAELNKLRLEKEGKASKFVEKIKKHKFITTTIAAFMIFSSVNVILIYNFIGILKNM